MIKMTAILHPPLPIRITGKIPELCCPDLNIFRIARSPSSRDYGVLTIIGRGFVSRSVASQPGLASIYPSAKEANTRSIFMKLF
jgi:hypothetical protein